MSEVQSGVYFVQAGHWGPIKIGFSDDVDKRIASLQTGNPEVLRLLLVVPGTMATEAKLHEQFASSRIRQSGEWFKTSRQLLEFVGQHSSTEDRDSRSRYTQAEYALQDCMIAWNPSRPWVKEPIAVRVGPLDECKDPNPANHWSWPFVMWDRAGRFVDGFGRASEWPFELSKAWLLTKYVHIVNRDGVPAADVHREFLKIEEYRDALSDDMPGIGSPLPEDRLA